MKLKGCKPCATMQKQFEGCTREDEAICRCHGRSLEFKVGDRVLLRIPKSSYGSLKGNKNTKLAHHYYGPYQVIGVGEVQINFCFHLQQEFMMCSMFLT